MKRRSAPLPRDSGNHIRNNPSAFAAGISAHDQRIRRGLEILKHDPKVSLDSIASRVNLSASRFRHLFKKETGVSPTIYVRVIRLKQAKTLLERSFLRVKEVAAHVGINDLSHFVRDYKALYGQTPSQTRAFSTDSARPIPRS